LFRQNAEGWAFRLVAQKKEAGQPAPCRHPRA
jgi:hypothetical protein